MVATQSAGSAPLRRAFARSFGKWVAIGATLVALVAVGLPRLMHGWSNPFGERTVDRTQPALLQSLSNLSRYEAASGRFEVVVDLEKDAKWMPAALRGERTTYLAHGTVTAGVDLSGLDASTIAVDPTTRAVRVTVPRARLGLVHLDPRRSKVLSHQRGLLDRLGQVVGDAPAQQTQLNVLAEQKLRAAAVDSDVLVTAERNTRTMLTNLVTGLGFASVTVVFQDPVELP